MKRLHVLFTAIVIAFSFAAHAQIIITVAGDTTAGYNGDGIPAVAAHLKSPVAVATDRYDNIFITDYDNQLIRKVNSSGIISSIAGTGAAGYSGDGGPATDATIYNPIGIVSDDAGNVYFSDTYNNCIRKINSAGIISTIAGNGNTGMWGYSGDGGPATAALLSQPSFLALDAGGNLYLTDGANARVRKINAAGIINTVAGGDSSNTANGIPATSAYLLSPSGIALDATGNLYITCGSTIRKVNAAGIIFTIAGANSTGFSNGDGGPATAASFNSPAGLAVDGSGNLYIADTYHGRIRKISTSGIVSTVAGNGSCCYGGDGGSAVYAKLSDPEAMAFDRKGNLYIADPGVSVIRSVRYSVGINEVENKEEGLKMYPNPCHNNLTIQVSSITEQEAQVTIMNTTGVKVKTCTVPTNKQVAIDMGPMTGIAPGIYFVVAATDNTKWCRQVVVE